MGRSTPAAKEPTISYMQLGEAIRKARQEAKLNQTQLAELLDTSQPMISSWENGNIDGLRLVQLIAIEVACGQEPGALLRSAGYHRAGTPAEVAIAADTTISDEARRLLLSAYQAAVTEQEKRR